MEQVTSWVKQHFDRFGEWPNRQSGEIADVLGETWSGIDNALIMGKRGLAEGSSISFIVSTEFGVRKSGFLPTLTEEQICRWAQSHKDRTGEWPRQRSGAVHDAEGERWNIIDAALKNGYRGLAGGITLRSLLEKQFGLPRAKNSATLTVEQILEWAQSHKTRTGEWPTPRSGSISGTSGESWDRIDIILNKGGRGLPGGTSLRKTLEPEVQLTMGTILTWISTHHDRTGDWPLVLSGVIEDAPEETWVRLDALLRSGGRGLAGGTSLANLLAEQFGVKDRRGRKPSANDSPLSVEIILEWASSYKSRTGDWPKILTGAIEDAPGESWAGIDRLLRSGGRGLKGGSSLPRLLAEHYSVKDRRGRPSRKSDTQAGR